MKKEAEKMKELLKEAQDHPLMKQIIAEKEAAIIATRAEAAREIAATKKKRDEIIPKLQAELEVKEMKYLDAKAALDTALGEFRAAKATLSSEGYQFDNVIRQHETVLYETADPRIDEAIIFFREKLDWLRSPGRISERPAGVERNIFTMTKTVRTESNVEAIHSAVEYCRAAVLRLEAMKLLPALDVGKIEEMKEGIPDIEVYTEFTGEKPFPRVNIDPLSLLKSDDQMEWELGKLNEKIKKVMKTSPLIKNDPFVLIKNDPHDAQLINKRFSYKVILKVTR